MPSELTRTVYRKRINTVLDHIQAHLGEDLSLETLTEVSSFSKFHFHRIFSAYIGETLSQFINRVRLERAAGLLISNRDKPVTDIAFECGFSGSAAFARSFKKKYGMNASEFRDGGYSKFCKTMSNAGETERNGWKAPGESSMYIDPVTQKQTWRYVMINKADVKVEVTDLPDQTVAYVRHIGPYAGDQELFGRLFNKLFTWAGARNLLQQPDMKVLCVYHDNPEITPDEKLRTDVCLTVPDGTDIDGDVGKTSLAGGKYAMAKFELDSSEYPEAWKFVYGEWLESSGYQPDDKPPFEWYHNDPKQHPEGKCIVSICLPVKPL